MEHYRNLTTQVSVGASADHEPAQKRRRRLSEVLPLRHEDDEDDEASDASNDYDILQKSKKIKIPKTIPGRFFLKREEKTRE